MPSKTCNTLFNSFGLFIGNSSGGIQVSSSSFKNCKQSFTIRNSNLNSEFDSNISNSTFMNGSLKEVEITLSENLRIENCLLDNYNNNTAVFDINESSQIVIAKNIINLSKIIDNKSTNEILMLNKICNHLIQTNQSDELIKILNGYNKEITIKEIELCLKIDKTTDFNVLGSKEKKKITNKYKETKIKK